MEASGSAHSSPTHRTTTAAAANVLAGLRYFLSDHIALFGEYKHNLAFLEFPNIEGQGAGFEGWYLASHIVGGLSLHF